MVEDRVSTDSSTDDVSESLTDSMMKNDDEKSSSDSDGKSESNVLIRDHTVRRRSHSLYDTNLGMHLTSCLPDLSETHKLKGDCDIKYHECEKPEENRMIHKEKLNHTYMGDKKGCCSCCGPRTRITLAIVSLFVGIISFIITPYQIMMNERLKMNPGLPAFDWWKIPPENIYTKYYLFNVTNHEAFLSGEDTILKFVEVGPVVYKEIIVHDNIIFNDNGTMTYTARRRLEFQPELNTHVDLNATIFHPNTAVLATAMYVNEMTSWFGPKFAFKNILTSKSAVFVETTIYNYLWNLTDPVLSRLASIAPSMVPTQNMGILHEMYKDSVNEATVFIGPKWGDQKFFTIDKFEGSDRLPHFSPEECTETLVNSTEGLLYSQFLTKETEIVYWRKSLCRLNRLTFENEETIRGFTAYRYITPRNAYNHTAATNKSDCYAGNPRLYDGLSDLSKCYHGLPIASSFPHFGAVDSRAHARVSGFKHDWDKHTSYAVIEPETGIPLESAARGQVNVIIGNLYDYRRDIMLFKNVTYPLFWMEICEYTLPEYVWGLIIVMIRVVPLVQVVVSTLLVLIGGFVIIRRVWRVCKRLDKESFKNQRQINKMAKKTGLV